MSAHAPHVTIVVHKDGALASRTIRIPRWVYRAAVAASIGLAQWHWAARNVRAKPTRVATMPSPGPVVI